MAILPKNNQKIRINAHGHLLPQPHEIPEFMKQKEVFWITNDKSFMCQGSWRRPITDPSFFLEEKILWMERNLIDKEVILNLSQLYCNGYERQLSSDVIRFQNDYNASIQHQYPDRFISGFVVQPNFVDDSINEIIRCVEKHKLSLLCLPTHYLSDEKKWKVIADDHVKPIFECANHYGLAVEIHPYNAEEIINLDDVYWRFHLIWMCAQTADAHHVFTLKGWHQKFTEMRTCFAHGNQFGQMAMGRRLQGFKGRPDLFVDTIDPSDTLGNHNLFFDTLVHDVLSFELLVKRQGVSQIVAGLDDPYPLGEMESVPDSYPGKVIDSAVDFNIISNEDRNHIWYDNVLHWLYGNKN